MWRQGKYNMKYEVQNIRCKIIFQDDRRRFEITEEKYKTCICQKKIWMKKKICGVRH